DPDRGLPVGGGRGDDVRDPSGPVEHGELRVQMQVHERVPQGAATPSIFLFWLSWPSLAPPGPGPTGVVDDPVENHIGVTLTIEGTSPPGKRRGEGLRPAHDPRAAARTSRRE